MPFLTTWVSDLALRRYKEIGISGRISFKEDFLRTNQFQPIFAIDFVGLAQLIVCVGLLLTLLVCCNNLAGFSTDYV